MNHRADPRLAALLSHGYLIQERIGHGGMGYVFRAWQLSTHRQVAIKVIAERFVDDRRTLARFVREIRFTAGLMSPHTVRVHDAGVLPDGSPFLVMELLSGQPLSKIVATEGPLDVARAVHIAVQICLSISEAHAQGLIHRDLKPGNVMVQNIAANREFAHVLDFGLVRDVAEDAMHLTTEGAITGTLAYISPEAVEGRIVGKAADIYSIGALLFELVTGRPPFVAFEPLALLYKHVHEQPPHVTDLMPALQDAEHLDAILMRCLAKKPEHRFADVDALRFELESLRGRGTRAA